MFECQMLSVKLNFFWKMVGNVKMSKSNHCPFLILGLCIAIHQDSSEMDTLKDPRVSKALVFKTRTSFWICTQQDVVFSKFKIWQTVHNLFYSRKRPKWSTRKVVYTENLYLYSSGIFLNNFCHFEILKSFSLWKKVFYFVKVRPSKSLVSPGF